MPGEAHCIPCKDPDKAFVEIIDYIRTAVVTKDSLKAHFLLRLLLKKVSTK